jgi:hypothetical protein
MHEIGIGEVENFAINPLSSIGATFNSPTLITRKTGSGKLKKVVDS